MKTVPEPLVPAPFKPALSPAAEVDVVVVGGGLAGLATAGFAARAGARVVVLERGREPGGRAATHAHDGFLFNVGPHALYDGGPATRALADLGVPFTGRRPPASGGLAMHGAALHGLPGGFVSLLTTDLLSLSGKLEVARVLGSLPKVDASRLRGLTLRDWLDRTFRDPVVGELLESLMRLTSYADDPGRSCAAASVAQLQAGLGRGVLYLDGGWATLVDGLRRTAQTAGAEVRTGCRAERVHIDDDGVWVRTATGTLRARAVVLAVPPRAAAALVEGSGAPALKGWAQAAVPVKAACLDLGLRRLPEPRRLFVVGIDRPLYFSVHSATARLAPSGAATIHVAKYLGDDDGDAKALEAELESFVDLVQPGWRKEVAERRYLPSMLVSGDLVPAGRARAGVQVPGAPRLLLAGDWVGTEGGEGHDAMLSDAAFASAREAARLALERAGRGTALPAPASA